MMRLVAGLAALSIAAPAIPQIPTTQHYGGLPPARYQGDGAATVFFLHDVSPVCGVAPYPYVRFGCARRNAIAIVHPCDFPDEMFARMMCHELGHVQGWPGNHGD